MPSTDRHRSRLDFWRIGSEWITGIAVGLANIIWYAVAIDYAVDSTLLGLHSCGLINTASLHTWGLGPVVLKSPVYLCTALFWIYITGMAGLLRLPGVIAALMRVYAPIALLLLSGVAVCLMPDLGSYRLADAVSIAANEGLDEQWPRHGSCLQLVTGFFAVAGLLSMDWGARVNRHRDLLWWRDDGHRPGSLPDVDPLAGRRRGDCQTAGECRCHVAGKRDQCVAPLVSMGMVVGIGGVPGGAILILFGLAALAPACYSVSVFGQKLSTHWPRVGQSGWTWLGGAIAFVLGATSCLRRLDLIYYAMGDIFGPIVGVLVASGCGGRAS